MTHSANATEFSDFPAESSDEVVESFEERVNNAVSNMTQTEDGKWKLPEGLSEAETFAANAERRRRDTQASFEKEKQKTEVLATTVDSLKQRAIEGATLNLTVEQKEELLDLKDTDPDAWRDMLAKYEQEAVDAVEQELSELGNTGEVAVEEVRRVELLQKFLDDNPGLVLDDEVFENDLPPRITSKLNDGKCTFEEFLEEAAKFLQPGTVVHKTDEEDEPNLGKAGGGSSASEASIAADARDSYRDEIY